MTVDIEQIEARLAAITEGPWKQDGYSVYETRTDHGGAIADCLSPSDARFIAHAPDDIAALIAEVKRLREKAIIPGDEERLRDFLATLTRVELCDMVVDLLSALKKAENA